MGPQVSRFCHSTPLYQSAEFQQNALNRLKVYAQDKQHVLTGENENLTRLVKVFVHSTYNASTLTDYRSRIYALFDVLFNQNAAVFLL